MAKRSYRWNETTPGPTTWSDVGSLVAAHIEQGYRVVSLLASIEPLLGDETLVILKLVKPTERAE